MYRARQFARPAAAITLAATMLAVGACAPSTSTQSGATGGAAATADGVLTVGLPGSLSTLDVAHEAGILNYYVAQVVSEGLLGVDSTGALAPALAESWETTDATTWTFTLREGATFQDGAEVTMEDVLFSIEVARDPERSPSTSVYWPEGVVVEATGDKELTITLPYAAVNFGWTVTSNGGLWVTSKAYYEAAGSYGSATDLVMGTGPYKATEFAPDSHVTFTKVDTWWGGNEGPDTVEFLFFSDESTRLLAFQSGEVDMAVQIPAAQLASYESVQGASVETVSDRSYVGLTFDAGVEPFDDIHVRRAIAHSIDSEAIVEAVLQGRGEAATSIEAPEQLGSEIGVDAARDLIAELPVLEFDMDKAAAELAQSKVPQGFEVELLYPTTIPEMGTAALAIAENLKGIGIELTVTGAPVEEWISTLGTGDYGLSYMSYTPTTGDAAEITGWLLGEGNPARYTNAEVQDLIRSSTGETDPATRASQIADATGIALADVAYSPIWWGRASAAFGPEVSDVTYSPYFLMTPWASAITIVD